MIEDFIPKGYKNRISRAQLQVATGFKDREIRMLIADAQERGVMIGSDNGGYFQYADSSDDLYYNAYLQREQSRAHTMLKKQKRLRDQWEHLHPREKTDKNAFPGQMSLFEEVV